LNTDIHTGKIPYEDKGKDLSQGKTKIANKTPEAVRSME
jgi:hypothetical protein